MTSRAEVHLGHAWLPAILPANARRVRAADPALAAVLAESGAELVERKPEVEIGPADRLGAGVPLVVSPLGDPDLDVRSFARRVAGRLRGSARVRVQATRARRTLRRVGYSTTEVLFWDVGRRLTMPGDTRLERRELVERLPQRAVVVGRGGERATTVLEAAVVAAAEASGRPLRLELASARAGPTTAVLDGGFLRIAVGPARGQLERQAAALASLRAASLPGQMAELVPWVEERGRFGLADWSLERRLSGDQPEVVLAPALLARCIDFLVQLHRLPGTAEPRQTLSKAAALAAGFCGTEDAREVVALGTRLDESLVGVPRGFGHGDFFRGNLLVEGDRLVGVVDWDAAGPGRLPLVDLIHLRHMSEHRGGDLDWGPSLVEHLLPWASAGGDEPARAYCRRVGLEPVPEQLGALVAAYWLHRVAYQLSTYADRMERPEWIRRNVTLVLKAFGAWVS